MITASNADDGIFGILAFDRQKHVIPRPDLPDVQYQDLLSVCTLLSVWIKDQNIPPSVRLL